MNPPISLVIPTFNRYDLLLECIGPVLDDPRVEEIVISDDASTDGSCDRLREHFASCGKVRVCWNTKNLDCYRNKQTAVQLASNPWVILFDDDNKLSPAYLDTIYRLEWEPDVLYCPEFAEPHFNYTAFAGETIDRHNLHRFTSRPNFLTALNTANYFFHAPSWL